MSFTSKSRRTVFFWKLGVWWENTKKKKRQNPKWHPRLGRKSVQVSHNSLGHLLNTPAPHNSLYKHQAAWDSLKSAQKVHEQHAIDPSPACSHCSTMCWHRRGGCGHTGTWTWQTSAGRKGGQQGYFDWGSPAAPGSWQSSVVTVLTCTGQAGTLLLPHISTETVPEASEDRWVSQLNIHRGNLVHRALGPLESHGKSRGNIMRTKKDKGV